jgi:hypothetical protein
MTTCTYCSRPIGPEAVFPGLWLCVECELAAVVVAPQAELPLVGDPEPTE